ncbi:MAG: sigma-54 dependent transcriptional regulator [Pirellulales bacterium]
MKATKSKNNSVRRLKVLFADDEASLRECLGNEIPRMGHEVTVCADGPSAVAALERNTYDCLLVDIDMPGMSGIQVIAKAREICPDADAIVLTGKSSFETAIAALRQGAFDYLTKPCRLIELEAVLRKVAEKQELVCKFRALQNQLERAEGKRELVGGGARMESVKRLIAKVAPTDSTVLILGETGTGKELVARAVHQQSPRADKPMVAINCGALPEALIESELFGHRKGAFTGADDHRVGLFEVAHGGTLFLDEIGELPKAMQAKLLRVLETREIRRVGDNESRQVDVRVVCATHRHIEQMVAKGDFREDLMFRINTFEIGLPSLRERLSDIPELAAHLYHRFKPGAAPVDQLFTPETLELLQAYDWPGNVRELANVIEHATILCDRPPITVDHLPQRLAARAGRRHWRPLGPMTLAEVEQFVIQEALERHEGNKPAAAEDLGISLKTLYNKVAQSQIQTLDKTA